MSTATAMQLVRPAATAWSAPLDSSPSQVGSAPEKQLDLKNTRFENQIASLSPTAGVRRHNVPLQTELLAEWNGCVLAVQEAGHSFSAALKGVMGRGVQGIEEDAVIPIREVPMGDRGLLKPGNFFRLSVVMETSQSGEASRYARIVFRRLPAYRREDLDAAEDRARQLAQGLRVE